MSGAREALRSDGLSKTFGAHRAVDAVSFAVSEGELLSIIGPNGAGKTTLFNLLTKDLPPTQGRVHVFGQDATALRPHEISRLGVGRSYQITSVFQDMTVYDNVWVSVHRSERAGRLDFWTRARGGDALAPFVDDALTRVGLHTARDLKAAELSYGDQRLLELAITLAGRPRLLLLDEPTSGLSQEETRRVSALIRSLAPTYTVVMIEHKMNVVMTISDRLLVMNFGAVIASGSPQDVAADPEVRRAYFGT